MSRGNTTWASGSPKRTLYSSSLGPSGVSMSPCRAHPGSRCRAAQLGERGLHEPVHDRADDIVAGDGHRRVGPMPPVLGPVSPSPTRLKSCAGASGTARVPSQMASTDSSGPARPSSITTVRPASPNDSRRASCARRPPPRPVARSRGRLARRQPVGLDHPGTGQRPQEAEGCGCAGEAAVTGGGVTAAASRSFIHALDPSSRFPSAPGPKTSRPAPRKRSARPSTNGASGPTTNRSASTSSGGVARRAGIPGFPGVTTTSAVRSTWCHACSRPPDPTTQTRTTIPRLWPELHVLVAPGPTPSSRMGTPTCPSRNAT